jgi:hypothetical protein
MAVDGPNAIAVCRAINGATRPEQAAPGSIRGDFALETGQNLVHASDSPEERRRGVGALVQPDELLDYPRDIDRWVLGPAEFQGVAPTVGFEGALSARKADRLGDAKPAVERAA